MSASRLRPDIEEIRNVCSGDCCESAVRRAYEEMKAHGHPEPFALDAALAVFRWHHADVPARKAEAIVMHWVREGSLH